MWLPSPVLNSSRIKWVMMRQGHAHLSDTRVLIQHICRLAGGSQGYGLLSFKVKVKIHGIHRKGLELPGKGL